MSGKVWQEFYCTISGGGCGKYFSIRLNMALNHIVEIVCPACGHEHQRFIEHGIVKCNGRHDGKPKEKIMPPKSAVSDTPLTKAMRDKRDERDGAVIDGGDPFLQERWFELYGGRR